MSANHPEGVTMTPEPVTQSRPDRAAKTPFSLRSLALLLLPLILLAAVLTLIVKTDAGLGDRTAPPIETLNVNRVTLPERGMIELHVTNDGPDPITIAQVLVD